MKEKMRSTMKKGAAAIQQATKNPPSLQDILKKRNASGSGEEKNEGGEETASKPTLAGAAAAALAKTKTKARESMAQLQKNTSKGDISSDVGGRGNIEENEKPTQNPRLALMNSLRKKTPTPSSEGDASASVVSADPRAALLGAIRSKSKGAAGGSKNGAEEITFVEGAEPSSGGDNKDDDSTKPSPILDPRTAMLAAIKKKKNNKGVSSSATEGGDAKQASAADDPRSALLNAIKTKKNAVGVAADKKDNASPELACIANRNLRSRSKGDSESQQDKNDCDTTKSTVKGGGEACTKNHLGHGDTMAQGLVLTKSEANLVLENLGDDNSVEKGPDSVEDTGTKKQVELSVATQMAQTDTLLVRACSMIPCIHIFLSCRPSSSRLTPLFSYVFYMNKYFRRSLIKAWRGLIQEKRIYQGATIMMTVMTKIIVTAKLMPLVERSTTSLPSLKEPNWRCLGRIQLLLRRISIRLLLHKLRLRKRWQNESKLAVMAILELRCLRQYRRESNPMRMKQKKPVQRRFKVSTTLGRRCLQRYRRERSPTTRKARQRRHQL